MHQTRGRKNRRRGYALVMFVFFMMICMALAALVIDLGFVRLSKRQMQTLTDAAALEIQRELDAGVSQPFAMTEAGPTLSFEDDGTVISGDFRAHPKLGSNSAGRWTPSLQLPQENLTDDILIGNYQGDQAMHGELTVDPSLPGYYERPDFQLDPDGSDVLVRLRRTGESLPEGGSAGPPVPFIWGRGMLIGGSRDVWQRIERGTFVRQTSIAQQAPARSAGPYIEFSDSEGKPVRVVGLLNAQVTFDDWQRANGNLSADAFTTYAPMGIPFTSIGDPAKASTDDDIITTQPKDYPRDSGYVTVVDQLGSFNNESVVIGFGYVIVSDSVSDSGQAVQSLTKSSRRGFRNTSASLHSSRNLTQMQWNELITRNREFCSAHDGVTAPVLVRSEE